MSSVDTIKGPLVLKELSKRMFFLGDLYYIQKNQKKIKLANKGDVITPAVLDKCKNINDSVELSNMLQLSRLNELTNMFNRLKDCSLEIEKLNIRNEFVVWFRNNYLENDPQSSLLELLEATSSAFISLPEDVISNYINHSVDVFKRSSVVGSLSVIGYIILGCADFSLLKDLFTVSMLIDYSLLNQGLSYYSVQAHIKEFELKGSGLTYLNTTRGGSQRFTDHLNIISSSFCKNENIEITNNNLLDLINIHHEQYDGKGISNGVRQEEMSDLEELFVHVNNLLPFEVSDINILSLDYVLKMFRNSIDVPIRIVKLLDETINSECLFNYEGVYKIAC